MAALAYEGMLRPIAHTTPLSPRRSFRSGQSRSLMLCSSPWLSWSRCGSGSTLALRPQALRRWLPLQPISSLPPLSCSRRSCTRPSICKPLCSRHRLHTGPSPWTAACPPSWGLRSTSPSRPSCPTTTRQPPGPQSSLEGVCLGCHQPCPPAPGEWGLHRLRPRVRA